MKNEHPIYYDVVWRNCAPYEPAWVVMRQKSGCCADAVAHFFKQEEAEEYSVYRTVNEPKHITQPGHHGKAQT
jgi:hypothetical protein